MCARSSHTQPRPQLTAGTMVLLPPLHTTSRAVIGGAISGECDRRRAAHTNGGYMGGCLIWCDWCVPSSDWACVGGGIGQASKCSSTDAHTRLRPRAHTRVHARMHASTRAQHSHAARTSCLRHHRCVRRHSAWRGRVHNMDAPGRLACARAHTHTHRSGAHASTRAGACPAPAGATMPGWAFVSMIALVMVAQVLFDLFAAPERVEEEDPRPEEVVLRRRATAPSPTAPPSQCP